MMEAIKESNAGKMSRSLLFALAHCLSNCTVGQVELPIIYFPIPTDCHEYEPILFVLRSWITSVRSVKLQKNWQDLVFLNLILMDQTDQDIKICLFALQDIQIPD